jgi:hypothetical protein
MRNSFLVKLSQANSADFQKVLDEISAKKESIQNTLISSPNEGIKVVNSALLDALKDSSYVNMPDAPTDEAESIEDTEWFKGYVTEDILNSIKDEVDKSNFEFELSYEEPVVDTEKPEEEKEGEDVGDEGLGGDEDLGGEDLGGEELGGEDLGGGEELGGEELGGGEEPASPEPAPEEGGGGESAPI